MESTSSSKHDNVQLKGEETKGVMSTSHSTEHQGPNEHYSFKFLLRNVTDNIDHTVKFLQDNKVIARIKQCPGPITSKSHRSGCGSPMLLKSTSDRCDGIMWRCRKIHIFTKNELKYCRKDVKLSIRHNTWLSDAKLPLGIIVELIYLWSQGFSNSEIQHELKISPKTIIEWTCYFREAVTIYMMEISEPIGGNGIEVEIDESKFGKRKYHKGHRVQGQWVFGGREKYDKSKIFMVPVNNRKQCTLLPIIKKWIKPGSIIHSDCWKAYNCLTKNGYTHVTVNHSKEFINKESYACTNSIESDWRHAKVMMPSYGVHQGAHSNYLGEFMWRRRYHNADKFKVLIDILNDTFAKKYMTSVP